MQQTASVLIQRETATSLSIGWNAIFVNKWLQRIDGSTPLALSGIPWSPSLQWLHLWYTHCSGESPFELTQKGESVEKLSLLMKPLQGYTTVDCFSVFVTFTWLLCCLSLMKPISCLWKIKLVQPDWCIDCVLLRVLFFFYFFFYKNQQRLANLFLL